MQRRHWASSVLVAIALAAVLAVLIDPAAARANPLTPASPQARVLSDLFWITLGIALVVLVAVEFLLVYTSLRFRKRPTDVDVEPAQIHGNTRLEVMWSILPAIILVSLFIVSVRSMAQLGTPPPNARTIQVVARQFSWEFGYADANVKVMNDLRVPVGQPVTLEVTSADVIHSFWVPDLAGKIDANPGITNKIHFTAERPGVYRGVCAELCGIGHANMLFNVTAMEATEFQAWLDSGAQAAAQQAQAVAAGPSPQVGRQVIETLTCGTCHTIDGVPGMAGKIGPDLSKMGSVAEQRQPGKSAEAYIRESIRQPGAFVAPGFPNAMPPDGGAPLTDQQVDSLVQYLLSLK